MTTARVRQVIYLFLIAPLEMARLRLQAFLLRLDIRHHKVQEEFLNALPERDLTAEEVVKTAVQHIKYSWRHDPLVRARMLAMLILAALPALALLYSRWR